MGKCSVNKRVISLCVGIATVAPGLAQAQDSSVLVEPSIPFSYDKGRNVSVAEKPRTEYDVVGIRLASFELFPKLETGVGYSSNIYLTPNNGRSSAFGVIAPSVRLASDWSRHSLVLSGSGRLVRYFDNSPRNEDNWNAKAVGRMDFGSSYSLTVQTQASREQEEPFTSVSDLDIPSLSAFRRNYVSVRGQYNEGRTRVTLAGDFTTLRFNTIDLAGGATLDQSDRNRDISRMTGQGEYALSPSLSVYLQATYEHAEYKRDDTPLLFFRDGDGWRVLGGVNIDLSGFLRGSLGVGYTRRNYDASIFPTVDGFSAEGKLEYFPTELTTVTVGVSRLIEDASIGTSAAFFSNRASLRVDNELLYNLLINVRGDFGVQDYIASPQRTRSWRLGGGARYLVSPRVQLSGDASLGQRRNINSTSMPGNRNEFRSYISILYQL